MARLCYLADPTWNDSGYHHLVLYSDISGVSEHPFLTVICERSSPPYSMNSETLKWIIISPFLHCMFSTNKRIAFREQDVELRRHC